MKYWLLNTALGPIPSIHIGEVLWDFLALGLEPSHGAITLEKFYYILEKLIVATWTFLRDWDVGKKTLASRMKLF